MQTGDYLDDAQAANSRDKLIKCTRQLCRYFEHDLSINIKTEPKAFWRYTNSKLKNRPKLGDLTQEAGSFTKDDTKKAQLLNCKLGYYAQLEPDTYVSITNRYHNNTGDGGEEIEEIQDNKIRWPRWTTPWSTT